MKRDTESDFWDNPSMYAGHLGMHGQGTTIIHNHYDGGGKDKRKGGSIRGILAFLVVSASVGTGIKYGYEAYQNSRAAKLVCTDSSVLYHGQNFENCISADSVYKRSDGTVGVTVVMRAIGASATTGTSTESSLPARGDCSVPDTAHNGMTFFCATSALARVNPTSCVAEVTAVREFTVSKSEELQGDVQIPTDPNLIALTSAFPGQAKGEANALISCPS